MAKNKKKNSWELAKEIWRDLDLGDAIPKRMTRKEEKEWAKYIANYYLEGEQTPQMIRYVAEHLYALV